MSSKAKYSKRKTRLKRTKSEADMSLPDAHSDSDVDPDIASSLKRVVRSSQEADHFDEPTQTLDDLETAKAETLAAYEKAKSGGDSFETRRLLGELEKLNDLIASAPKKRRLKRSLSQNDLGDIGGDSDGADEAGPPDDADAASSEVGGDAADADAADADNPWTVDDKGNKVKQKELVYLKDKWAKYKKKITDTEPGGVLESDTYYFPEVDWAAREKKANKEYQGMNVAKMAKKYSQSVDNKNWVLMSEPHGQASGFALARRVIAESKTPGVLMLEAPTSLNLGDDMVKTVGFWGGFNGQNTEYGVLAKFAKDKGWDIVTIDATGAATGSVDGHLLNDSGIPGQYQTEREEHAVGHLGRQYYIGRNAHDVMTRNKNKRGGILLIGTKHISDQNVPDLSPMVSSVATEDAPNSDKLLKLKGGKKVLKDEVPFRVVEVDKDTLLPEVNYNPQ